MKIIRKETMYQVVDSNGNVYAAYNFNPDSSMSEMIAKHSANGFLEGWRYATPQKVKK